MYKINLKGPNSNNQLLRMVVLAQCNPVVIDFGATMTFFLTKKNTVVTTGSRFLNFIASSNAMVAESASEGQISRRRFRRNDNDFSLRASTVLY
jgi:hypothetical protein